MNWGKNGGISIVKELGVHSVNESVRENYQRQEIQLTPFLFTYTRCWIIIALDLMGIVAKKRFDLEGYLSSKCKVFNFLSV